MQSILSLIGLVCDLVGFMIVGRQLFKKGGSRPFWASDSSWDQIGFCLIVLGFAIQAVAQMVALVTEAS